MKKFLIPAAIALLVVVPALMAGDYHCGSDLICSDCHVMHYSQQHGYNAEGTDGFTALGAGGPFEYLLRDDANGLCLACHDGGPDIDVFEANTGSQVRPAGAMNEGNTTPYFDATGHTLGSTDAAPGGTWVDTTLGLQCTDCHEAHCDPGSANPDTFTSNGQYRNLRSDPGGTSNKWVQYAIGTNDLFVPVYELAAKAYDVDSVFFNEPLTSGSYYADWCKGCHTDFHGSAGDANMGGSGGTEWLRHPTADADIGDVGDATHSSAGVFGGLTNHVKVMTATDDWSPDSAAVSDHTPSCFSCHKAHGNQNAFGLIFMKGTGTVDEEGDDGTVVRDLCKQCHVQG